MIFGVLRFYSHNSAYQASAAGLAELLLYIPALLEMDA